jgi:uncharacterized protein YeaO (DUF488 family)
VLIAIFLAANRKNRGASPRDSAKKRNIKPALQAWMNALSPLAPVKRWYAASSRQWTNFVLQIDIALEWRIRLDNRVVHD